ncbi:MAG: hypothetical protein HPY66_2881 [Firmicutes bacterium]|nr:hypothetical protein [Bacillota bacterium]
MIVVFIKKKNIFGFKRVQISDIIGCKLVYMIELYEMKR